MLADAAWAGFGGATCRGTSVFPVLADFSGGVPELLHSWPVLVNGRLCLAGGESLGYFSVIPPLCLVLSTALKFLLLLEKNPLAHPMWGAHRRPRLEPTVGSVAGQGIQVEGGQVEASRWREGRCRP